MEAEFASGKLWFGAAVRGLKLGGSRNVWGRRKRGSTWLGNYPPEPFASQPHKNIPPYAGNLDWGLRAAGPREAGKCSPGCLFLKVGGVRTATAPPQIGSSRHNGPVCHVVELARQYEGLPTPTPTPAPGQVGGWGPKAQPGVFIRFPLRTGSAQVRRRGEVAGGGRGCHGGVGGGRSASGNLLQSWSGEAFGIGCGCDCPLEVGLKRIE